MPNVSSGYTCQKACRVSRLERWLLWPTCCMTVVAVRPCQYADMID